MSSQSLPPVTGLVSWAVNKIPMFKSMRQAGMSGQSSIPAAATSDAGEKSYEYLLVNLSQMIREQFDAQGWLRGDKEQFVNKIVSRTMAVIDFLKPTKTIVLSLDGVKPLQQAKFDYARTLRAQEVNRVNLSDFYPGARLAKDLEEKLNVQIAEAILSGATPHRIGFVLLGSNMPGDALYKLRFFMHSQKHKQGFNQDAHIALVDQSDQAFLSALALHLNFIDLIGLDHTVAEKGVESYLDIWIFKQFIITEFALINEVTKTHIMEAIFDDIVLISFLLGTDLLPKIPYLSFENNGMDYIFYLYKRMYPFLNGNLSNKGVIYQVHLHIFMHELALVEDSIAYNQVRRNAINAVKKQEGTDEELSKIIRKILDAEPSFDSEVTSEENAARNDKYAGLLAPSKCSKSRKATIEGSSESYWDCISDCNKYGERFLEGMCEDLDDTNHSITELLSDSLQLEQTDAHLLIRPGEKGYKEQFYKSNGKCQVSDLVAMKQSLTVKYFEGIVWHFASYYREYPSWNWEFTYHFGPFAEDLHNLSEIQISFTRGSPLTNAQFMLLMTPSQLAPTSSIPPSIAALCHGEESCLRDLFPEGFSGDATSSSTLNGVELDRFIRVTASSEEFSAFSSQIDLVQSLPTLFTRTANLPSRIEPEETLLSTSTAIPAPSSASTEQQQQQQPPIESAESSKNPKEAKSEAVLPSTVEVVAAAAPQQPSQEVAVTTTTTTTTTSTKKPTLRLIDFSMCNISGEIMGEVGIGQSAMSIVSVDIISAAVPSLTNVSFVFSQASQQRKEEMREKIIAALNNVQQRSYTANPAIHILERALSAAADPCEIANRALNTTTMQIISGHFSSSHPYSSSSQSTSSSSSSSTKPNFHNRTYSHAHPSSGSSSMQSQSSQSQQSNHNHHHSTSQQSHRNSNNNNYSKKQGGHDSHHNSNNNHHNNNNNNNNHRDHHGNNNNNNNNNHHHNHHPQQQQQNYHHSQQGGNYYNNSNHHNNHHPQQSQRGNSFDGHGSSYPQHQQSHHRFNNNNNNNNYNDQPSSQYSHRGGNQGGGGFQHRGNNGGNHNGPPFNSKRQGGGGGGYPERNNQSMDQYPGSQGRKQFFNNNSYHHPNNNHY